MPQERPTCAGCGDLIGVYEPAWIEREQGALHPCSLLNLDPSERGPDVRIWHASCAPERASGRRARP